MIPEPGMCDNSPFCEGVSTLYFRDSVSHALRIALVRADRVGKCLDMVENGGDFHSRWGVTGEIGSSGVVSAAGFGCGAGISTILCALAMGDGRGSAGALLSFGAVGSGSGPV